MSKQENKYNDLLLEKFKNEKLYNLLKRYDKNHPMLKLLTFEHYKHLYVESSVNADFSYGYSIFKEIAKNAEEKRQIPSNIPPKIQQVAELLHKHFKTKLLSLEYITNFFIDIQKEIRNNVYLHKLYCPQNIYEVLNMLYQKFNVLHNLRHYSSMSLIDRLQFNNFNDPLIPILKELNVDYDSYIKTLSFKKEFYDKESYEQIVSFRSNRRFIGVDNDIYNYIPIICKRYCSKGATEMHKRVMSFIEKCKCKVCAQILEYIKKNKIDLLSEFKLLYFKTCIFSHNSNEIKYHPLRYKTCLCENDKHKDYYYTIQEEKKKEKDEKKEIKKEKKEKGEKFEELTKCPFAHDENELQFLFIPSQIQNIIDSFNQIYLFEIKCDFPKFKVEKCHLFQTLQAQKIKLCNHDFSACPYSHANNENRRMKIEVKNKICESVIEKDEYGNYKWKTDENIDSLCCWKEKCPKFHRRNELFFDSRNYRKIYDCYRQDYCDIGELCPYKHPIDIKIDELYLPEENKKILRKKLNELKKKDEEISNLKKQFFANFYCIICQRYDMSVFYFLECCHILCENCVNAVDACPMCDNLLSIEKTKVDMTVNLQNK